MGPITDDTVDELHSYRCDQYVPQNRNIISNLFYSIWDMMQFVESSVACAWHRLRKVTPYTYCGANPKELTEDQKKQSHPILLLHGVKSDESSWRNLLADLQKQGIGPVFTLNIDYDREDFVQKIQEKASEILQLYGQKIELSLVGHSLGAIKAAHYVYVKKCEGLSRDIHIDKIVSLAGRLRITGNERWKCFFSDITDLVNETYEAIKKKGPNDPKLFTLTAENDWLVPANCSNVLNDPSCSFILPDCGHLSILHSSHMLKVVASLLKI